MRNLTEDNATEAVLAATLAHCTDPRTRQVMASLIRHLHGFVRDVEPSAQEWMEAIRFVTAVGQKCDDRRQEVILLSDTLGVTVLVDAINNRKPAGATESTVLGPFYREGAPERAPGARITGTEGESVTFRGRVIDALTGAPLPGALLDVWQAAPSGLYDVQDPTQPPFNLRGKLRTDDAGRYELTTIKPTSYPIPTDGPVGVMLARTGRPPFRPAHTHFIVSAAGYKPVVTQLFLAGDPHLDSDAVFGVKSSLVVELQPDGQDADGRPRHLVARDFGLEPA